MMNKRLIMTLLVRDEEDILEKNIRFHLSQGVDFIVAIDNGSIDETPKILQKYQDKGLLKYSIERAHTQELDKWVSQMAWEAVEKYGATHLFHNDADEFWYTKGNSLKDCLPEKNKIFLVRRYNFLPNSGSKINTFQNFQYLGLGKDDLSQMSYDEAIYKSVFNALAPKVLTTSRFTKVKMGNHDILTKSKVSKIYSENIFIFHFPIRSYSQFEYKVVKSATAYQNGPHAYDDNGWHIKSWYKLYKNGQLESYYEKLFSSENMNNLISKGIIKKTRVPMKIKHELFLYSMFRMGSFLYSHIHKV